MFTLNFYINRAGKNLDSSQKRILKEAKSELRKYSLGNETIFLISA